MSQRDESGEIGLWDLPASKAGLGCLGVLVVLSTGLFLLYVGAWSGLVNPALPVDVRCAHVVDFIFIRHWFVTFPCIAFMTGGMYLLVTAVLKGHRQSLKVCTAVVLAWVVVGLIVGLFLVGQIVH